MGEPHPPERVIACADETRDDLVETGSIALVVLLTRNVHELTVWRRPEVSLSQLEGLLTDALAGTRAQIAASTE